MSGRIRVLIVDDSELVCDLLAKGLAADPDLEVVGTASDPYVASQKIIELRPQVLTLDVEMPRMNGIDFLRKLMPQYPLPAVIVSALTEPGKQVALDALAAGAVDIVTKPKADSGRNLDDMLQELRTKIKIAACVDVSHWKHTQSRPRRASQVRAVARTTRGHSFKIIALGASTGGTEALRDVLSSLPNSTPGIVVVQHMPPGFTRLFAARLNSLCAMEVKEAEDGDLILPGRVLVAPGGFQFTVKRDHNVYKVKVKPGEPVNGHCPSVDMLMQSIASEAGSAAIGVLMTGMGRDGADGLKAMRAAGARTLAQDEASSVVFGMPKVAWQIGAAEKLVPLEDLGPAILGLLAGIEEVR
ncbi:MAG TPA: chemotaxis response regulator protein-glutamate methylesterase [Planctomycetota bacterium]|jgi:two-component system chemotaxis response regulator CheB